MASDLFHELYHQAHRADCWLIYALNSLAAGMDSPGDTVNRVEVAQGIHAATKDFMDDMEDAAVRFRSTVDVKSGAYYRTLGQFICPNCHSPYCQGAVLLYPPPPGIVIEFILSPSSGQADAE